MIKENEETNKTERLPLVSVCIPVYNNEQYIAETMQSIWNQSYKHLELIVVDDNSRDNSLEVIRRKADALEKQGRPEKKVSVYHNETNLGMSGNWNRCLELCHGEFIKLICADDQIASTLIEREVQEMLLHPDVVLVESDTEFRDNDNRPSGHYDRFGEGLMDGRKIARHSLFTRDYFGAPLANLIRTDAYKKYGGFDPQFSYIVDYDFFMDLACHGKVFVIRERLNYFRIRKDSNTGEVLGGDQGERYVEEHRNLAKKYAPILGLTQRQVERSVRIRKLMNFLGGIYLKMKLNSKN
jgi:glycosyltransferase involved in cell wall biosynthesis